MAKSLAETNPLDPEILACPYAFNQQLERSAGLPLPADGGVLYFQL